MALSHPLEMSPQRHGLCTEGVMLGWRPGQMNSPAPPLTSCGDVQGYPLAPALQGQDHRYQLHLLPSWKECRPSALQGKGFASVGTDGAAVRDPVRFLWIRLYSAPSCLTLRICPHPHPHHQGPTEAGADSRGSLSEEARVLTRR